MLGCSSGGATRGNVGGRDGSNAVEAWKASETGEAAEIGGGRQTGRDRRRGDRRTAPETFEAPLTIWWSQGIAVGSAKLVGSKTIEGTATMCISCFILGFFCFYKVDLWEYPSLVGAVSATLIELLSGAWPMRLINDRVFFSFRRKGHCAALLACPESCHWCLMNSEGPDAA